jgi:hypothetical protein
MQLVIACIKWGYPAEYANRLLAGVRRNLALPHRFVCVTQDPAGLDPAIEVRPLDDKWPRLWNQLELFRHGTFLPGERVLYLDLDTVITGDLAPLAAKTGAIHLKDWGWARDVVYGGLMVWDAGIEHLDIYPRFGRATPGFRAFLDDPTLNIQDWMTLLGGWNRLDPSLVRSYRYHCIDGPPPNCRAVCFHGEPKPHAINKGWVPGFWTEAA